MAGLIDKINHELVFPFIGLLFAVALVVFIWGLVQFFWSEEKKDDGKQHMLYGVLGLLIMVSVYGILNVICTTISC